jgi:8-oxo-dGTP diphosphatase
MDRDSYLRSLPRAYRASAALVLDDEGRILMVQPTYKPQAEPPGGVVETAETPSQACIRECREELGVAVEVTRLLAVDHQTKPDPAGDSSMFVYGVALTDPDAVFTLPARELSSWQYVHPDELESITRPRIAARLTAAWKADRDGEVAELGAT